MWFYNALGVTIQTTTISESFASLLEAINVYHADCRYEINGIREEGFFFIKAYLSAC